MIDRKFKILLLVLVLVLIANTVLHFTHPAYRYYTQNVSQFRSDYNDFVRRVQHDFIPVILSVSSNRVYSSSTSFVTNSLSSASRDQVPSSVDARYFVAGGRPGFTFNNFNFFQGDDFYGYTILDVRPTIIITDGRVFLISNSSRSLNPSSPASSTSNPSNPQPPQIPRLFP